MQNTPITLLDTVTQHAPTATQLPGDASINALEPFLSEHHYSCEAINTCIYLQSCRKSVSVWASTCGGPGISIEMALLCGPQEHQYAHMFSPCFSSHTRVHFSLPEN